MGIDEISSPGDGHPSPAVGTNLSNVRLKTKSIQVELSLGDSGNRGAMKDIIGIVRSAVAVLAGLAVVVALSTGADYVALTFGHLSFGGPDPTVPFAIATIYRSAAAVAGGYTAARLAPEQPMLHAIILGMIGVAVALFGCITRWNEGHHWYPIALVITALPCTWLGGKMAAKA